MEFVARNNNESSSRDWRIEQTDLPPPGSRVMQGPDMSDEERSFASETGTVVHHHTERGMHLLLKILLER